MLIEVTSVLGTTSFTSCAFAVKVCCGFCNWMSSRARSSWGARTWIGHERCTLKPPGPVTFSVMLAMPRPRPSSSTGTRMRWPRLSARVMTVCPPAGTPTGPEVVTVAV